MAHTATYKDLKVKDYNRCCHKELSLRHPRCDLSATLRSLSEQPFDFTMHYTEHRESMYARVNVTQFSHSALKTIIIRNSYKKLSLMQKMHADPCSMWAKSVSVVSFWRHELSRKFDALLVKKIGAVLGTMSLPYIFPLW